MPRAPKPKEPKPIMSKKIIRVFPRRTNATPDDEDVRIRDTPSLFDEADEVHISVAFTWDLKWAEWAEKQWKPVAPVKIRRPAFNEPGGEFVPGMYMKKGYVITSRGCPNRCWFCAVPKREGGVIRELPVTDGWILTDDNLLACSDEHINEVFEMLKRQPHKPQFVGGLEAKLLTKEMATRLKELKPRSLFFAYDTPDDLEALKLAATQAEQIEQQQKQLQSQAPKVLFANAVETSQKSCLIGELAKILRQNGVDIGEKRLFQWLRQNGYLCSYGERYNQPTQKSMDRELFELKKDNHTKPSGEVLVSMTPKVTGKGRIYFVNKFLSNKESA